MQQIKSFAVLQTAKIMGIVDFFLGILVGLGATLRFVMRHHGQHHPRVLLFFLFVPILYAVGGFVITAIFCGIYNWVARRIGGITFELTP
ncbi:MAG TPA: hypothetical protein VMD75_10285 [Candidatus Binataceae bacterium]|nr:hypothetical protein [Candidatus Binataceae bacterium]